MKKPIQRGTKYFEFRSGLDQFVWEGMATKVDPGASPPNRPRFLVNTRIQGGSILARPNFSGHGAIVPRREIWDATGLDPTTELGWDPANSSAWSLHWAAALNPSAPTRMWFGGNAGYYGFIDTDYEQMMQSVGVYTNQSTSGWGPDMAKYNNEFYVGDYGSLRKIYLIAPQPGVMPSSILSNPADEIITTFQGFRVSSMLSHAGKLFFVLSDPLNIANGFVYSWDGQHIVQELAMASPGASGTVLTEYYDTLVLTIAGVATIQVRNAAGTWSGHTVGGFVCSGQLNSTAVYRDKLYIMSGTNLIHSWDGTNLVLARTIAVAARTEEYAHVCAVMQGRFYYFWTDTAPDPNQVVLGYLDLDNTAASQWNDVASAPAGTSSFIANPGAAGAPVNVNIAVAAQEYRARLWVVVSSNPTLPVLGGGLLYTHSRQYAPWDVWYDVGVGAIVPGFGVPGPGTFQPSQPVRSLRRL